MTDGPDKDKEPRPIPAPSLKRRTRLRVVREADVPVLLWEQERELRIKYGIEEEHERAA